MATTDIRRPFTGPERLAELVRFVEASVPVNETLWLEWKSGLDLAGSKSDVFAVAKGILGFANRMPNVAERFGGGYAYFVVGAEAGWIQGQDAIDNDDLVKKVHPYVGPHVSWRPHWVEVDRKNVLVVEVDPPQWGDRQRPVLRQFSDSSGKTVAEGQVYVRRQGGSHPANAAEIGMLEDRFVDKPWRVDLRQEGQKPLRLAVSGDDVFIYADDEENDLLQPLIQAATPKPGPDVSKVGIDLAKLSGLGFSADYMKPFMDSLKLLQDSRSPDEFRDGVTNYKELLEKKLKRGAAIRLANADKCELHLSLQNLGTENLSSAQVELAIEGDVIVFGSTRTKKDIIPRRPEKYGTPLPLQNSWMSQIVPAFSPHVPILEADVVRRDGVTYVTFLPVDLRARRPVNLRTIQIVSFDERQTLRAEWSVTVKSHSDDYSGTLEISFGNAIDLITAIGTFKNFDDELDAE